MSARADKIGGAWFLPLEERRGSGVQSLATVSGATTNYTRANVRFCQAFASAGISCYTCALRSRPIRTKKPLFLALLCPAPCKSGLIAPGGLYKFLRILSTFAPFGLLEFRTVGEWGGVKRDTLARVFGLFKFPGGSRISPGNSHICPAFLSDLGGFPVPVRDKPGGQVEPLGAVSSLPARRKIAPCSQA